MQVVPRWSRELGVEGRRVLDQFVVGAGTADAVAVDAGDGLLLLGGDPESIGPWIQALGPLLVDALECLRTVAWARRRDAHLDLGLAWTAHELRGPVLSARLAMDSVLAQRDAGPEEPLALLARQQLDELATLVDKLLHWSVGMSELRTRRVNLARVARQAVEACSLESGGDRLRLTAPERLLVQGDHDHLRGVIVNLVRNAMAYSPEGTPVLVEVCSRSGMARVSVTDRGCGVSEEESEAIFDPFVRGVAGSGRKGGGLGLFIARRVAEAHGGTVRLQSDGRGSTFQLELPRD